MDEIAVPLQVKIGLVLCMAPVAVGCLVWFFGAKPLPKQKGQRDKKRKAPHEKQPGELWAESDKAYREAVKKAYKLDD